MYSETRPNAKPENVMGNYMKLPYLIVFFVIAGCSQDRNHHEITENYTDTLIEKVTPVDKNIVSSVQIDNSTEFEATILLEANGEKFYNPESPFYYSIGKSKIGFIDSEVKYFLIPGWNLQVEKDTVTFQKNDKVYKDSKNPKAFINYSNPNKYEKVGSRYLSNTFGEIVIKDHGLSCDDSFSGSVLIIKDKKELKISGLANVDIFESKNKELFILSYHNCLLPDLKIIKIRQQPITLGCSQCRVKRDS